MYRFSANYANTDHNFVIQNVQDRPSARHKYLSVICVLKNILQRGCPTLPSKYLCEHMDLDNSGQTGEKIHLIDNTIPDWRNLIKGDEVQNYFPAREFFYEIIPSYLDDFKFIQQLILPEAEITEITGVDSVEFYGSRVDFYLPQAKLVIEIDGVQHKGNVDKLKDELRNNHLYEHGISTIRIESKDIREKNSKLEGKIQEIRRHLLSHNNILCDYKISFEHDISKVDTHVQKSLMATAILRFQITILKLLESGMLNVNDSNWNLQVIERDVSGFADIAIKDLFVWLKNLCKLSKINFVEPQVNIKTCSKITDLHDDDYSIKIDFSLLKRWTNDSEQYPDIVFVRTDYYDDKNYFKVSASDPIKYKIVVDGKDSDLPALSFLLENIFNFKEFNSGQLPIIINALACNDTIGLLPTGSGKSLCYQLVALLQPCISFVVVPIKSLMYDQKYNLDKRYITHTNYISSDQTPDDKAKIQKNFSEGKYLFVWISPERFQTRVFREYLDVLNKELNIGLAVIDEVHCISEWGHDFRTSYLNLSKTIRKYCPSATFLGLTATASVNVLKDILVEFEVNRSNVKTLPSFTRPELTFKVIKDEGKTEDEKKNALFGLLNSLVQNRNVLSPVGENTKSGIIFTPFVNGRNGCYMLSNELTRRYNTKVYYYSGEVPNIRKMPVMNSDAFNKYKQQVQKLFQNNEFSLLVATKAFGMGIDKSNIRYTIHYGIPGSMEALYQEAGRAGRDKEPAGCYVLYSNEYKNKNKLDKIFDLNSTVDEIRELSNEVGFDSRDMLRNIFLWLSNRNSLEHDFNSMKKIFDNFAELNASKTISAKKVGISLSQLQKVVYQLSLIGVVEDWIINDWNQQNGIIEVYFSSYSDESIMESLVQYIQKYDKKFNLNNRNKQMDDYHTIADEDLLVYEKACKILLKWQYENISYNRRQSIKNLADLCENFSDSKGFQNTIEDYFKFTDITYNFDFIAEEPEVVSNWFSPFFKVEDGNHIRLAVSEVESLKVNLSRFLESYRYNMGLNFISGIIRLILNDYQDRDGKVRLQSAFEQINDMTEEDKDLILYKTLEVGKAYLDQERREDLSELLITNFRDNAHIIYAELKDNYSLNYILSSSKSRLNAIGEKLL